MWEKDIGFVLVYYYDASQAKRYNGEIARTEYTAPYRKKD